MNNNIPHDTEAEQAILGSLIENNELISELTNILNSKDFYLEKHNKIHNAIIQLSMSNLPVDELTIADQLKKTASLEEIGGLAYLAELVDCVPSSGNMNYYAMLIKNHSILRNLIQVTSDIGRKARDPEQGVNDLLIEAQKKILKISESRVQEDNVHIKEVLLNSSKQIEIRSENKNDVVGIKTGFNQLDALTCGLIDEALIIVAARPSMGKTAFALNIAESANLNNLVNGSTLIFTKEMSQEETANRMVCSSGRINTRSIKTGNLKDNEWDKLFMSMSKLSETKIYINKKANSIDEIKHSARTLNRKDKNGVGLIVVDYIQLFSGSKKNMIREQEISEITRELKKLAGELCCPVLALSQLNRSLEKRTDKRPILSDLRESGAIEQDADIIFFIYREDVYRKGEENYIETGDAEINIAKHRDGPTGMVKLGFVGKYTKFMNMV